MVGLSVNHLRLQDYDEIGHMDGVYTKDPKCINGDESNKHPIGTFG